MDWDFFVSAATEDRPWAEWIAWRLEEAGYGVVLQAWDFTGGNFVDRMHAAIDNSAYTLAVLSRSYWGSDYCRDEWGAAYNKKKLVQVLVQEFDVPGLASTIQYDDFTLLREAEAITKLLKIAARIPPDKRHPKTLTPNSDRHRPDRPDVCPPFPGMQQDSKIKPKFFDRRDELAATQMAGSEHRLILLDAPAGYGKTSLLGQYLSKLDEQAAAVRRRIVHKTLAFTEHSSCRVSRFLGTLCSLFGSRELEQTMPPTLETESEEDSGPELTFDQFIDTILRVAATSPTDLCLVLENVHLIADVSFAAWLREHFIPDVRARLVPHRKRLRLVIVVTGRLIYSDWRDIDTTQLQVPLPLFNASHSAEIIREKANDQELELPESSIDLVAIEIDRLTGGHPASVLRVIEYLIDEKQMAVNFQDRYQTNYIFGSERRLSIFDQHVRMNTEAVLKDLQADPLWESYQALSVFRCFFAGLIHTLQASNIISDNIKPLALIDRLEATGYVKLTGTLGLFHDPVLRRVIALHLKMDNPERYRTLNDFAWRYWDSIVMQDEDLTGQPTRVVETKQIRCILEALYHFVIKSVLDHSSAWTFLDDSQVAEVLASVTDRLRTYSSNIRSSTGPLDTPIIRRSLRPMLEEDQELKDEVRYLLGMHTWERLTATSAQVNDIKS